MRCFVDADPAAFRHVLTYLRNAAGSYGGACDLPVEDLVDAVGSRLELRTLQVTAHRLDLVELSKAAGDRANAAAPESALLGELRSIKEAITALGANELHQPPGVAAAPSPMSRLGGVWVVWGLVV